MRKLLKHVLFSVAFIFLSLNVFAQEICNNGIDDDGDGLIDLNDTTDCACSGIGTGSGGPIPSLIPNPSFESMNCCPTSYSQVNCATDWIQASGATSDYLNTCGFVFSAATFAGLVPFPDGNGILGAISSVGYQEYVGSCLSSPMLAGTSYTIQFNIASTPIDGNGDVCNGGVIDFGDIDITIFGTTDCNNLPFSGYGCPDQSSGFDVLGFVNYTPVSSWGTISITFTPTQNINAIVLGSPCIMPSDYSPPSGCYPYFYYDNLILNNSGLFNGMQITTDGGLCTNDYELTAHIDTTGGTWQWYYEGVAIASENDSIINISNQPTGAGNYSAVYWMGTDCIQGDYEVTSPDFPVASYTFANACLGNSIQFTNTSTIASGSITDFDWNFDDGNLSTIEDPSNLYTSAGTYDVQLIITSNQGCTDTIENTVTVNPNPVADFDFNNNVCANQGVIFDDQSIPPSPYTITDWIWNINGTPFTGTQNPSYVLSGSGTYTAQLIVINSAGCSDTISQTVTVLPNPNADFNHIFHCLGSTTEFTDISTVSSPQNISQWEWEIDGNNFGANDVNYVFPDTAVYNVTLTVTTNSGCIDSITLPVTILPNPEASFDYITNCDGEPILFTNTSAIASPYQIVSSIWIINGDTILVDDPSYPFQTESQVYPATIIVTADNGCSDSLTLTIIQCTDVLVPNVFTPNGDGNNDTFIIEGLFGMNNKIIIFNRWGQIVYENDNYQNDWTAPGMSDGTYYYIFHSNTDQILTGFVTVLR